MSGKLNRSIKEIFWKKFTNECHQAIIKGYHGMLINPLDYKQWKEEKISARLLYEMKKLVFLKTKNIIVGREHPLEDEEILFEGKEAQEAERIDFSFSSTWNQSECLEYFGEAKNLSYKDWNKSSGSTVKASNYRARYVDTGIKKVTFGEYAKIKCFLIGYIVNGTVSDNIEALNALIQKRKLPPQTGQIENQMAICDYSHCYTSENQVGESTIRLQHIFLAFDEDFK